MRAANTAPFDAAKRWEVGLVRARRLPKDIIARLEAPKRG